MPKPPLVAPAPPGTSLPYGMALTVTPTDERVELLCLSGVLDTLAADVFGQELEARVRRSRDTGRRLVLDLTGLRLVSAAALQVLDLATRNLTATPVLAVVGAPHIRELLLLSPPAGLRSFPTLAAALASLPTTDESPDGAAAGPLAREPQDALSGRTALRQEVFGLRAKNRTGPIIGVAQGILRERYDLPDLDAAFGLLRDASQHLNVPLRILASAVVTAPRPRADGPWFPGRRHTPMPAMTLLGVGESGHDDRRTVIESAVDDVMTFTTADAAEIHLTDAALDDALVLEGHAGLDAAYHDQVALLTGPPALAAQARAAGEPVFVPDIAADPVLGTSAMGRAALAAGSSAVYALPALTGDGSCMGVITVHRHRPGSWMNAAQRTALGALATDLAAWRSWYRRTVVLDALEHLHTQAQASDPR
ncbi:ANTAR domain-containing protein [Streptomyces aureus]